MKYPRTYHLPWSPGFTSDDKVLTDLSSFVGERVIGSKKMDGENTTMRPDFVHARSLDSRGGIDRDWVKQLHAQIAHSIPENWRICGENLWARHAIHYIDLPSYFMGFSIWDDSNMCLSWDDTLQYFDLLGIVPVPVIYDGIWDEAKIRKLHEELDFMKDEGFVIRLARSFHYDDFGKSVAKYVRKGHVDDESHWRTQMLVPNELKK